MAGDLLKSRYNGARVRLAFASRPSKEGITHRDVTVEDASTADPTGLDIAIFSAGATTSRALAQSFVDAGVVGDLDQGGQRRQPVVPHAKRTDQAKAGIPLGEFGQQFRRNVNVYKILQPGYGYQHCVRPSLCFVSVHRVHSPR